MQLHIVKRNNEFVILNPPKDLPDKFFIEIDREKSIEQEAEPEKSQSSRTFMKTKKVYEQMPDDDFIKALHESTPPDYQYKDSEKDDDDLLYDALKDKYEL